MAKNNIFEDLARVSSSVASVAFESAKSAGEGFKGRVQGIAKDAGMVSRDEFEVLRNMVLKLRAGSDASAKEMLEIGKELAEVKRQMQNINSAIDVVKVQVAKLADSEVPIYDDSNLLEGVEKLAAGVSARLNELEERVATLASQPQPKTEVAEKAEKEPRKKSSKKAATPAPAEVDNNVSLFGDEQA